MWTISPLLITASHDPWIRTPWVSREYGKSTDYGTIAAEIRRAKNLASWRTRIKMPMYIALD